MSSSQEPPPLAIFGPDPLLSVTIEARGRDDDVHVHAAGQGVWVARMAAEMGAEPILCCLLGGETGAVLEPLLAALPGSRRVARTGGSSGSYVVDRRLGRRVVVASRLEQDPAATSPKRERSQIAVGEVDQSGHGHLTAWEDARAAAATPSLSACLVIASASSRSRAPSSRPGRMWQWRSTATLLIVGR